MSEIIVSIDKKDYKALLNKFGNLENIDLTTAFTKSGLAVERQAKININTLGEAHQTGQLARETKSILVDDGVEIGSTTDYAMYVHEGTGIYAKNGNGRKGWWVYYEGSNHSKYQKRYYTHAEAKRVWHIINKKYKIPAEKIWITQGQRPHPYLTDALHTKQKYIQEQFEKAIREAIADD